MSPGRPRQARNPGSQPALRRQNTQRVLEALAQAGPTTQAKLARQTGLSTGTISNIVKDLGATQRISTRPVIDSGRRAIEISLNDSRCSIGLDVDATQMRIVIARLDHTVLSDVVVPLEEAHSPVETLRLARRRVDVELARHQTDFADVVGAGVALPTVLDEHRQPLMPDALFPAWFGHNLAAIAETTFPFPVTFENDANAQAIAHTTWGPWSRASMLMAIKLGTGIGAGLIADGVVLRGASGAAGELGHLPVPGNTRPCACGNRGCLQTVAAVGQVVGETRRVKHQRHLGVEDVIELARKRDAATMRVLEEAGLAIGAALATAVTLLNPHAVVISGPLAPVGPSLLDPINRAVARHAHPGFSHRTVVSMSQLGPRAEALGVAALAAATVAVPG